MGQQYILNNEQPGPSNAKINYREELNSEQCAVVENGDGPCLVLAGAGSGKTRTLVYRVAYLIEKGVPTDSILLVTFTNKAAKEMLERVEHLLGGQVQGLWGGTFHSTANRILRQYGSVLGYDSNFGILDSDDSKKLIKQVMTDLGTPKGNFMPKTKVIYNMISFAKNSLMKIEDIIEEKYGYLASEIIPHVERISAEYERRKKETNVMDFDDLLYNWLRLLADHPDVAAVLSSRFEYVLVDEFQDTNKVQANIVARMAVPQQNLLVVGDDAQSIYSFRAATVENILGFQKLYPEGKMYKLETNYRSSPEILQLANESIRNNQFQYAKQLKANQDSFKKPILVACRDQRQQAQVIAQRILELRDEGKQLDDIAVLFRSSFQIIELELELGRRGIPYMVRGGLRFFEQAHIKDVLAYIKLLQNPKDEMSWRRILGLYEGVGPASASKVWSHIKTMDSLSSMASGLTSVATRGKAKGSMLRLQNLLIRLIAIRENIVANCVQTILEGGYQIYMERTFDDVKDRLDDLSQLAIFANTYNSLDDFLSEASLSENFQNKKGAANDTPDLGEVLVLSTIHQAKGLEWDVVFGISLAEGQFPHYRVMEDDKEMEEERRLFYVVVTRARNQLYLTYPIITRSAVNGDQMNRPSQFVREVDRDLFDEWEITEQGEGVKRSVLAEADNEGSEDIVYIDESDYSQDNKDGGNILDILRSI